MRASLKAGALLLVALLLGAASARSAAPPAGVPVARVALVERQVEQGAGADKWHKAKEGSPLLSGERIRTAADAVVGLEFPWMSASVGPSAAVSFPDDFVLSTMLEQGRVELHSEGRDILKLITPEAEVRGRGRVVVRRENGATLVMSLEGRFLVEGAGKTVILAQGKGTIVQPQKAPIAPVDLAAPPEGLWPGSDPVYVDAGQPVDFKWESKGTSHQVELLPVGSDLVLMQRDVGGSPWKAEVPWTGAFRWRVSTRDARGLEGMPSEGLICVVEK